MGRSIKKHKGAGKKTTNDGKDAMKETVKKAPAPTKKETVGILPTTTTVAAATHSASQEASQLPRELQSLLPHLSGPHQAIHLNYGKKTRGTFYAPFRDVWSSEACPKDEIDEFVLDTMVRASTPETATEIEASLFPYLHTFNASANQANTVKDDQNSATTSHNAKATKESIWPCDIFGHPPSNAPQIVQKAEETR